MSVNEDDNAFEKILASVGDNGIYQSRLLWWFLIPVSFLIPWTALIQIFQVSVPDHWCRVPNKPENITTEQWKNMTIPWISLYAMYKNVKISRIEKDEILQHSKCKQFIEVTSLSYSNTSTVACQNGWEYDHTWYDNTLPMQLDWVCEKDSFPARWLSIGIAGNGIGILVFNVLADIIGRKFITLGLILLYGVSGIVKLYVTSFWALGLTIFINSMVFPALLEISLILVLEQVSGKQRARISAWCFNMWAVGMSVLPLIAWLCRDWVLYGILTSVVFFPFVFAYWNDWLVLESPRWTLSTGKVERTIEILQKIAKINKVENPNIRLAVEEYAILMKKTPKVSYLSLLNLFSLPTIRKRTILMTLAYAVNNLVYYGLVYNISNLSGNEFLNFFLISITELPSNLGGWYCAQKYGRRWSQVGFLALCSLCLSVAAFIHSSSPWWHFVMTSIMIICKSVICGSFLCIYLQFAELYPTSHRASGAGFSSIVTKIFVIASPYIAYSNAYWFKLPYIIIFLICLIGTFSVSFIPETLGAKMPQNIQEADEFLTDQRYWSYLGAPIKCCRRSRQIHDSSIANKTDAT